jgi:hypothetical protein
LNDRGRKVQFPAGASTLVFGATSMHQAHLHMQIGYFVMLHCSIPPSRQTHEPAAHKTGALSKKGKRTMSKFFLAVATILSLGAGSAMAKPAPVTQGTQIASNQVDILGPDQIRDRRQIESGGDQYLRTTTGAHATEPALWEPESINLGTEP